MELSDVDQARLDNFASRARNIAFAVACEETYDEDLAKQAGAIAQLKELYDAYPDTAQEAIRKEFMPRMPFTFDMGYDKCPHCINGRTSPDKEEVVPKLDAEGNQVMRTETRVLRDTDGSILTDDDGQPITKDVEVPVMVQTAFEKVICGKCNGSGEVKRPAEAA